MKKSKKLRWAWNAARMDEKRNAHNLKLRVHSKDLGVGGTIILKWILWK
jgi:hypothetical protein